MSYRSIKRALGETNIERKCRILFGICLGILVCGAFFWVERLSEQLVQRTNEQMGSGAATSSLLITHMKGWMETFSEFKGYPAYVEEMSNDLVGQDHEFSILSLGDDEVDWISTPGEVFATDEERPLLEALRTKWLEKQQAAVATGEPTEEEAAEALLDAEGPIDFEMEDPLIATDVAEDGRYVYYQPVYWTDNCTGCHRVRPALSATDAQSIGQRDLQPFRVLRVTLPQERTQQLMVQTRAVLIAAAILTIFLAMVALYLIVRYVIVKPLKHLRDVSDEVSHGNTALRAEIYTNDEFEELADAFNRMLHNLIAAQGELRNVNKDLDAKVDELAQLNMRLYEMNRLKSDFLANMTHELRTPLNSIIGFSEVLQGIESLNDRQKRYADNIQKSGKVLLEMINDILDLAKLEAGKMEVRPTEFQIDIVLTAQCDMVRPLSEEKNIDLELKTPTGDTNVYQDQSKIQQILTNLLSNAIKFTPEGGRILVEATRTEQGQLKLSVADTGVGIPEEDHEIIFEKFRQSEAVLGTDGLTREFSGTGLGLSIVKELCKLLGGEISFTSDLGKGSTFTATIPWDLKHGSTLGAKVSRQLESLTQPNPEDFTGDNAGQPQATAAE